MTSEYKRKTLRVPLRVYLRRLVRMGFLLVILGLIPVFLSFLIQSTAANRLTGVVEKLLVYPETMLANMNKFRGLIHSQRVLLALTQKGVSREDSYRLVQRNAMKVWEQGADFLEELLGDADVRAALPEEEIRALFDLGYHTKHVDTIFARVFGQS